MANRFISDLHFHHMNIIKYDNRPFENVDEHDAYIVQEWNKVVAPEDDVYILGDILLTNGQKMLNYRAKILSKLNGKLHLVVGNHDGEFSVLLKSGLFESVKDIESIVEPTGRRIVACHYPLMSWANMYKGCIHLYGHVHNFTEDAYQVEKYKQSFLLNGKELSMYNVCASLPWINYVPRTLEEIISGYEREKRTYRQKLEDSHIARNNSRN